MNQDHRNAHGGFELRTQVLGGLPVINRIIDRLGLPALLGAALPGGDARVRLSPAAAIRLVVANLVLGREPLYALGQWAAGYDPGLLGLSGQQQAPNCAHAPRWATSPPTAAGSSPCYPAPAPRTGPSGPH